MYYEHKIVQSFELDFVSKYRLSLQINFNLNIGSKRYIFNGKHKLARKVKFSKDVG